MLQSAAISEILLLRTEFRKNTDFLSFKIEKNKKMFEKKMCIYCYTKFQAYIESEVDEYA